MLRRILPALILLALPLAASAQRVRVDAHISPATGRVGDVVILDITVVTSGPAPESIETPSLPGGLRNTGSNDFTEYEFRLPGGRMRSTRRELTLTTVAPGHYVIPPLAIRVDGATYRTRPLRLDVA
ncbi:MAG TPA: BatD family protein, partial [Longimicrobiales bacterium]